MSPPWLRASWELQSGARTTASRTGAEAGGGSAPWTGTGLPAPGGLWLPVQIDFLLRDISLVVSRTPIFAAAPPLYQPTLGDSVGAILV